MRLVAILAILVAACGGPAKPPTAPAPRRDCAAEAEAHRRDLVEGPLVDDDVGRTLGEPPRRKPPEPPLSPERVDAEVKLRRLDCERDVAAAKR